MKLRIFAAFVLLLPYATAIAQSIGDLVKSAPYPETMSAAQIPEGYRAVQLKTGSPSAYDSLASIMWIPMMMSGGTGSSNDSQAAILDAAQVSWTKGEMVQTETGQFVVTYKIGLDGTSFASHNPPSGILRLVLVRKDSITEITPRSDLTRERMAELFPTPGSPQATAPKKGQALSNMKQVALGMIMYTSDYDDVMPYAQDSKSAFAVIQPYMKNVQICRSLNPTPSRILLNMAVSGVSVSDVAAPAETVLFYDEVAWPDGTRPVAFMDGHAKLVDEAEWSRLQPSLHLKIKRKAKPLPPDYWKSIAPGLNIDGPGDEAAPIKT